MCGQTKLGLGVIDPKEQYKEGTVGALVSLVIDGVYAGNKAMLFEVFKDIQGVVAKQYRVKEEDIDLLTRIEDLDIYKL